ncbi:hypothetical protein Godav_024960, partial [Gossypium davidsonii]|nr:hypothetical protein [Gossypium davidsonii]
MFLSLSLLYYNFWGEGEMLV